MGGDQIAVDDLSKSSDKHKKAATKKDEEDDIYEFEFKLRKLKREHGKDGSDTASHLGPIPSQRGSSKNTSRLSKRELLKSDMAANKSRFNKKNQHADFA